MKTLIHTKIKPLLLKLIGFFILEIGLAKLAFAQIENPLKFDTFGKIIQAVAGAIATVGITVAGIFIIYSGFLFVTSRGNEEQLKKAKTTFFWTMIGTLLVVGAWAIAAAINEFLQKVS